MKKYICCLLTGMGLLTGYGAKAQIDGVVETTVTYRKPASRRLPDNIKTYDVRAFSNYDLGKYGLSEGQISAAVALDSLQRMPMDGDLHLVLTIGTAAGPHTIQPKMVNTGDYVMSIEAPIYTPVYFKLMDNKGLTYEEDSALSSSYQKFSVAFRSRTNVEPPVSAYTNNALLETQTASALQTNVDWINFLLNEEFFGSTKHINVHLFFLKRSSKFGLDGLDKNIADTVLLALNQFTRDQQWAPLEAVMEHAAAYWEVELAHLDQVTPTLKTHDDRYNMLFLKYDLYYNLAQAYMWLKDGRRVDYYLDRCHLLKERDGYSADADHNFQEIFPPR